MILSLRKRHLQAWILIAILLVIIVPLAVVSTPEAPIVDSGEIQFSDNNIIQAVDDDDYSLKVVEGKNEYLMKLELKKSLKSPAPQIYAQINGVEVSLKSAGAGIYTGRFEKSAGSIEQIEIRDDLEDELYYQINLE